MREIKFRAWDNKEKLFVFNSIDIVSLALSIAPANYDYYNIDIMQYTGLKDKNGVEIYEGDIVEYGTSNSNVFYAECIFENAKFQWKIHDTDDTYNDYDILAEDEGNWIEIIGNIYENHELLEQQC